MLPRALLTTQADPPQQTLGAVGGWESLCTTAQSAGDRWEEEGGKEASEELAQELPTNRNVMEDLHSLESSLVLSSCLLPGSFCGHLFLNPISWEMSPHGHTASVKPMHLDRIPIQEFAEIQPKHRILKVGQGHSCPLGHSTLGCVDSLGWDLLVYKEKGLSPSKLDGSLKEPF